MPYWPARKTCRCLAVRALVALLALQGAPLEAAQLEVQQRGLLHFDPPAIAVSELQLHLPEPTPAAATSAEPAPPPPQLPAIPEPATEIPETQPATFAAARAPAFPHQRVHPLKAMVAAIGFALGVPSENPPSPPSRRSSERVAVSSGLEALPAASGIDLLGLPVGWNLISLPKQPADPAPAAVLAPIAGSFSEVWTYDACSADPWQLYDPNDPSASDLASLDHRPGIWIEATAPVQLPVEGILPESTTLQLCTGWNLIGFPAGQPRHVRAVLAPLEGKYQRLFGYDAADLQDPWEVFDPTVPDWASDLELMVPGRGYWLLVSENASLTIHNEDPDGPDVAFVTPADLDVITQPTDIVGTVASGLLESWALTYRAIGDPDWLPLASQRYPVANAKLATFDPTLLENGLYELKLSATDVNGLTVEESIALVVEGQMKIGHFTMSFVDLEVELAGIPIQVIRSYDSRRKDKQGDFGYGWELSIRSGSFRTNRPIGRGWRVTEGLLPCQQGDELLSHLAIVRLSDTEIYRFRPTLHSTAMMLGGCSGKVGFEFLDGPEVGASLEYLSSPDVFWANGSQQLLEMANQAPFDPSGVRLTTRDGRIFEVDRQQGLTKVQDANGNHLILSAASIRHSTGDVIDLERNAAGRIARIEDLLGHDLTYGYDAAGDLITFKDRVDATTTFGYRDHYLESIRDPLGRVPLRNEYGPDGRLTKHVDAYGKSILYEHRLDQNQEVVTNRLGHSRLLEYDARGNLIREVNELGKITLRTFDEHDRILTETDPLGHVARYRYDAARNLTELEDALGNKTRYSYNTRGNLLTTSDPRDQIFTNVYDGRGNVLTRMDPLGNVTTMAYDEQGNLTSRTDAIGGISRFEYDARGRLSREIDALGNARNTTYDAQSNLLATTAVRTLANGTTETLVTQYAYDPRQLQVAITLPDGTASRREYDAAGQVKATIDALGRRTNYIYDQLGRQVRISYFNGTLAERSFDAENRPISFKDQGGRITSQTFDPAGRLVRTTYPDGASTENVFDDVGRLIRTVDTRQNSTNFEYDALGRRTKKIDALGFAISSSYDALGNLIASTDPKGNITTYAHDALGRQTRIVFADGTMKQVVFDALGRQIREIDQEGVAVDFGYDALGRLTDITDALGGITRYRYDEVGNRIAQTDANLNITGFEFDSLGRQKRRILPDGSSETRSYDAVGNVVSRTDFNGATTQYTYDAENRLSHRTYPNGSTNSFTYTATGRRQTAVDNRGTTSYAYDSRDRLTSLQYPDGRELRFQYDPQGNRTLLKAIVGPQTLTTTYTYDALDRLEQVIDPEDRVTSHSYDPNGNRLSLNQPNGVSTSYLYDALNRLKSLAATRQSGGIVASFAYVLGPTGKRIRVTELDGTEKNYSYDRLYRLTAENVNFGGADLWSNSFSYDAGGNRLIQGRVANGEASTSDYTYDTRDRLQTEDTHQYGWDVNGNLISRSGEESVTYTWDFENRLTKATLGDGTIVEHFYDVDGTRVRTVTTPVGGQARTVEYLVDTSGRLDQVILEGSTTGDIDAFYVRGDDLLSVIRPVTGSPSSVRYFHLDGLGSIRALTEASGVVTDTWQFEAFGNLVTHTGSDPNAFLFAGQPLDPQIGWYYNRARWMAPAQGRFVSVDPFRIMPYEAESLHRYLYVGSDPANKTDPTGLYEGLGGQLTSMAVAARVVSIAFNAFGAIYHGAAAAKYAWLSLEAFRNDYLEDGVGFALYALIRGGLAALSIFGLKTALGPMPPMPSGMVPAVSVGSGAAYLDRMAVVSPELIRWVDRVLGTALISVAPIMMAGNRRGFENEHWGTPGNNQAQNKQFHQAVREAEKRLGRRLTDDEIRRLHDEISGEGLGFWDLVDMILAMFK